MNYKNINWFNIFISFSLVIFLIIFSFIGLSIRAISTWANYQNICISEESINTSTAWAVRKCNGRSKVYKVNP